MTINKNTGGVTFDELGLCVESSLTRSKFLATPAFRNASVLNKNEPFCRFLIPRIPQVDTELCVVFQFRGERLESIELCHSASRFGTSWDDVTEQNQLALKTFHDEWLMHQVHASPGNYRWGCIDSGIDHRSLCAYIMIGFGRDSVNAAGSSSRSGCLPVVFVRACGRLVAWACFKWKS